MTWPGSLALGGFLVGFVSGIFFAIFYTVTYAEPRERRIVRELAALRSRQKAVEDEAEAQRAIQDAMKRVDREIRLGARFR